MRTSTPQKPRRVPPHPPAHSLTLPADFWGLLFMSYFSEAYDHYPTFLRLSKGVRNRVLPHLKYREWVRHVVARRASSYVVKSPSDISRRTSRFVYTFTVTRAKDEGRRPRMTLREISMELARQELLLDSTFVKEGRLRREIATYLYEEATHLVYNEPRAIHLRAYLPNPLTIEGEVSPKFVVIRRRVRAH